MKRRTGLCVMLWMVVTGVAGGMCPVDAGGKVSIGEAGEYLELSHESEGRTVVDRLPLYRSGSLRYFSAGIGVEERTAEYPPFSLKLVFTAGGKPFLAGVAVTIQPANGGSVLTIPRDHVEGPWLFVDLPTGVYDVAAVHGDKLQSLKGIKVESGKQKTVYLRWVEDRGIPADVMLE